MADIIANLVEHSLPWTLGTTLFYACAQYYQHGGPTHPKKSKWFWTAADDEVFVNESPHQATDSYVSTLLQTLAVPTITITPTVPTKTVTTTSTTTVKACTRTFVPFAETVIQTVSVDITTTETSTLKPTFTKTIMETVQPTQIVYSDSAPPGFLRSNTWTSYLFYFAFAFALGVCARLWYQLRQLKKSKFFQDYVESQRRMDASWDDMKRQALNIVRRNREVERKEQEQQKVNAQIKREAESRVAEASRELNALRPRMEHLRATMTKDMGGVYIPDVAFMSPDLKGFEMALKNWQTSMDALNKERSTEVVIEAEANRSNRLLVKQLKQAHEQLNKCREEDDVPTALSINNMELMVQNKKLMEEVCELEGKVEDMERQSEERERQ